MKTGVMNSKNKTVILKDGNKFRFHKMLNDGIQRWTTTKEHVSVFFKVVQNGDNTKIFNDENYE